MDDLLPWFRLKTVPGIGNLIFKRLVDRFESPQTVLSASREALLETTGMTDRLVAAMRRHKLPGWVTQDLDQCTRKGYRVITQASTSYPQMLLQIPDPPPLLYALGDLNANSPHIAVVGSRNATGYGLAAARRLAQALAERGLTVVSGMARGIDTAAHKGALQGKGQTIAVLGSGLDNIYPQENVTLAQRIKTHGAVISEFPLAAEPDAHHFPARNRIISGICLGTVIVEATKRSGSLITARLAAEQNREVFAVPGSIQSFKSTGTHTLIKQGAKLVEHVGDILEELPIEYHGRRPLRSGALEQIRQAEQLTKLSQNEKRVYEALSPYPTHLDDLVRSLGLEAGKLVGHLLQLELKGLARQSAGKMFSRSFDSDN